MVIRHIILTLILGAVFPFAIPDFRMEKVEEYKLVVGTVRNALVDLLAGTLGGIATVLVGQPLDTVKVGIALSYRKTKC